MPSSFGGLLLFVVLLAPGFAFVVRRETRFVPRNASIFRETAAVVLASVVANSVVLAAFAVVRARCPAITPDVGAFVADPHGYFEQDYLAVTAWGVALLGLATALAALAAVPPSWIVDQWKKAPTWLQPAWLEQLGNPIVYKSAWDRLMHLRPDDYDGPLDVWVSCELIDGTWLAGELYSLNPDVDEDPDREIILVAPIQRRGPDSDIVEELDVGAVSISARNINYVGWSYVQRETPVPEAADVAG